MTSLERMFCSRLLYMIANKLHDRGWTDADASQAAFEGISTKAKTALVKKFRKYWRNTYQEDCKLKLHEIGEDQWLAFIADLIGGFR